MDDDLIQLRVADVKVAVPAGNGVEAGLVVLEEDAYPYRTLRMFIGQPEARAIHVPWSNTIPPRPSTWDLFVSTIAILDGRIERVVITDVEELRHYFAQIAIVQNEDEEPILITARPSDALALALRSYGAKIYAQPHVLDQAGVLADGTRWVPPEEEEEAAEPEPTPSPSPDAPPSPSPDASSSPAPEAGEETVQVGSNSDPNGAENSEPAPPAAPDLTLPAADAPPATDDPAASDPAAESDPPPTEPDVVTWPSGVEEIGPAPAEPPAVLHAAQETPIPVTEETRTVVEPAVVEPAVVEPAAAAPAEPKAAKDKGKKDKGDAERKKAKKKKKLAKKKAGKKKDAE